MARYYLLLLVKLTTVMLSKEECARDTHSLVDLTPPLLRNIHLPNPAWLCLLVGTLPRSYYTHGMSTLLLHTQYSFQSLTYNMYVITMHGWGEE